MSAASPRAAAKAIGGGAHASARLGKDLLALEPLSRDQIQLILDTAEPLKEISERAIKKVPTLRGQTVVNLFFLSLIHI